MIVLVSSTGTYVYVYEYGKFRCIGDTYVGIYVLSYLASKVNFAH